MGALTDLVHAGKVRSIGSSTFLPSEIVEAQWTAERRGRERFVCEQPPYSILVRGIEADVLPTCDRYGMVVIPWSPLGGGWLSGKWRHGGENTSRRSAMVPDRFDIALRENQRKLDAADALGALADDLGVSLVHLALAWAINHPTVRAAIIGPRTMDQLESQLGASTSRSRRPRSTASTRSFPPAPTSGGPTPGTRRPVSPTPLVVAADPGTARVMIAAGSSTMR